MRVLQLNVTANMSTGGIAVDLVHTLTRLGHTGCVAFARGPAPKGVPFIRVGDSLDFRAHGALSRLTDRAGFYSKRATQRLLRDIEAYKPDIIHLHNLHGYYLNLPELFTYLKKSGVPLVWTLHDCWAFTGHCPYFEMARCDRWRSGCHDCPQRGLYPKSLLLDQSARNYAEKKRLFTGLPRVRVTTPSKWLSGLARLSFLGDYPVQTIPNGIDLSVFRPVESDVKKRLKIADKRMILSVANTWHEPRKGLKDIVELSGRLGEDYAVVVVGLTAKQIDALPKSVIRLPRTSGTNELAQLYTSADLYVCASREESMGLTPVEAMACGTQVLLYDSSALPEQITPETGLAVAPGDMKALKAAVISMCESPKSDAACRERAAQNDKRVRYMDYIALYQALLGFAKEGAKCEE